VSVPYGWAFAVLCLIQGLIVAAPWMRPVRLGRSRVVGLAIPVIVFLIGLAATRGGDWGTQALTHLATFGTPLAAMAVGVVWGWRMPWLPVVVAPLAWIVAWRVDGLVADVASVALIVGACLTLAAIVSTFTPPWALAVGLIVLAIVDSFLVFGDQVRPGTEALHAVIPPVVGGHPLPALQDATLQHALFGWLDILAPALGATLLAGFAGYRTVAAILTATAALALGLLLAVTDQVPGTIPALVAVLAWLVTPRRGPPRPAQMLWTAPRGMNSP
jgi:hypothetical protein